MTSRMGAIFVLVLLIAVPVGAQVYGEDAVIRPKKVDNPPVIDGLHNDPVWAEIEPITDFRQYEPDNGAPTTERTEVRICYDSRFLYFAVRAFDTHPERIIANVFERDSWVDADDTFTVSLDSHNDNRTAFAFDTNVLGTKLDVQIREGGGYNISWDAIWFSKGHIDEQGYTLEIAIPFFALRFKPAEEVEMGILLERIIRHKNEQTLYPAMTRDYDFDSISRYGRLVGLKGIERGVDLEVKPYGIAGYSKTPGESDYEADAGLDVKWGLTSNLTADLTLNPDFAHVESDALKINLTRFGLFFPEKRDFFIESSDLFQFGLAENAEVFFSRRIGLRGRSEVPIIGGARTYGMVGDTRMGLLTMQTRESGGFGGENFSVARVKHNILGRSYIGGIVTSRRGVEELKDTTVGGDFMYLSRTNFKVYGHLARSGRPGIDEDNWMGTLNISHTLDRYDWMVQYDDIGANFDPGIGFIRRPDQRTLKFNAHYKPRPGWKGVRQIYVGLFYQRTENHDGVLETRAIRPGFLARFQTEDSFMTLLYDTFDLIPYPFYIAPDVIISAGEYNNRYALLIFDANPMRRFSVDATGSIGTFYGGNKQSLDLSLLFKAMPRLHIGADIVYDHVDIPGGNFSSLISQLLLSYYFSPTLTTRMAAQYSTLYEELVFNFRLRWIYAPESEVWLVYDEGRRFDLLGPSLQDRALILKVVYNFNF